MRISDWSSDVCSSDLLCGLKGKMRAKLVFLQDLPQDTASGAQFRAFAHARSEIFPQNIPARSYLPAIQPMCEKPEGAVAGSSAQPPASAGAGQAAGAGQRTTKRRSEEHTSELQSLMRISYAVFCLKKKKQNSSTWITHKEATDRK